MNVIDDNTFNMYSSSIESGKRVERGVDETLYEISVTATQMETGRFSNAKCELWTRTKNVLNTWVTHELLVASDLIVLEGLSEEKSGETSDEEPSNRVKLPLFYVSG